MGINAIVAEIIERQLKSLDRRGKLAVIGVQDIEPEVLLRRSIPPICRESGCMDLRFFEYLGFKSCKTLEISNKADIYFDLNVLCDDGSDHVDSYDCVIDSGTLEHVFDIKSAIFNLAAIVKVGGEILHFNPMQGYCNHGFYNLQPTFFHSFYKTNGFEVLSCGMLEYLTLDQTRARYIPIPDNFNNLDLRSAHDSLVFVHARKISSRPPSQLTIPTQEFYRRLKEEKARTQDEFLPEAVYRAISGAVGENKKNNLLASSEYFD